jgi:hypothetical protein
VIPYDIDPSLHTCEPEPPLLDDGFSPPHHEDAAESPLPVPHGKADLPLGEISPF